MKDILYRMSMVLLYICKQLASKLFPLLDINLK